MNLFAKRGVNGSKGILYLTRRCVALLTTLYLVGTLASAATAGVGVGSATNDGSNLVVFDDAGSGVRGAFVASDGTAGPTFVISPWGGSASTATDGTDHLVVWAVGGSISCWFGDKYPAIYGAVVNGDGTVSDSFPIADNSGACDIESRSPSPKGYSAPRVGYDGGNFFVVWSAFRYGTGTAVEGARVTRQGVVLDPNGVPLAVEPESTTGAWPRLAFDGTNFLVVYLAASGEPCIDCSRGLYATRVNTKGGPPLSLDPEGIPITVASPRTTGSSDRAGAVAFDGLNWVVSWIRESLSGPAELRAARVNRAGVVLDPLGVVLASGVDSSHDIDGSSVAFDGINLLVVWSSCCETGQAAVLKSDPVSGFAVLKAPFDLPLVDPEVGVADGHFLVAGETVFSQFGGVRIASAGELLDPTPFPISQSDTTPPQTTISSGPPATTSSESATFEFSSSEGGSTFQCRLDGGAFSTCSSPATYTGLSGGTHTFEVAAKDGAGNTDGSPATWAWTIDTSTPETNITSGPSGLTNQATATFSFSSNESGSSFDCRLDGAMFSSCSSPMSYTGLTEGSHTFEVRAKDGANNVDLTPASQTWSVDTSAPAAPSLVSPANGSSTSNAKPTFDWSDVTDQSGVVYHIQIDNSGSNFPSPEVSQSGLTASSFTPTTSLAVGTYSWRVLATDGAGNGTWSSVFTVTITTPPGSIAGKVTDGATKKAISGSTVNCGTAGTATTGSDGSYSITGVAPGSYTCTASATGYKSTSKTITVKSGSTTTLSFALRKG